MDDETSRSHAGPLRLLRCAAVAVATGRVVLGATALTRPSAVSRPWVGASADELGSRVFARALGARDLALGLGALGATCQAAASPRSEAVWYAAGALSDVLDLAITVAEWPRLPSATRWLIAASAGGAAVIGVSGTVALVVE